MVHRNRKLADDRHFGRSRRAGARRALRRLARAHIVTRKADIIIVEGVEALADDDGEDCVTIPNVNGLHKVIATEIATRHASMNGRELRSREPKWA